MSKEPEIVQKEDAPGKNAAEIEIEESVDAIGEIVDSMMPDDDEDDGVDSLIPHMNVNLPVKKPDAAPEEELVTDEALLEIYADVLKDINEKEREVSDYVANMAEMVFNEGDATTSSKEALVNFVKIETDLIDKKVKVADLMTRIKLKARDTFPRYLAANQNNTINIGDSGKKRQLLEAITKAKKKKE
jgi:hypothetical protein